MKIETLERLWRANDHDSGRTAHAYMLEAMLTAVERRRNSQRLFLLSVRIVLATVTLVFGYAAVRHGALDPLHQWAALLMLA